MKLALGTVVAAVAGLALAASTAKANFIAVYTSNAANVYNYTLRFSPNESGETLRSGDTVTLYDISVPASITSVTAPAGFTVSQQLTGITPADLVGTAGLPDSNTLQNITFTYTGADRTTANDFTGAVVTMASNFQALVVGKSAGVTEINFNLTTDNSFHKDSSIRSVLLPAAGTVQTPEPASLAVMGLAAASLMMGRRRKA